jgi:hypothetical protein
MKFRDLIHQEFMTSYTRGSAQQGNEEQDMFPALNAKEVFIYRNNCDRKQKVMKCFDKFTNECAASKDERANASC